MYPNNVDIKFINKKQEFYKILTSTYPVSESNKYTHTSINDPKGSWHIPLEFLDSFYKFYVTHYFTYNIPIHLTEKHINCSPILIDLDFKYNSNNNIRSFDNNFIIKIIKLYNKIIKNTFTNISNKMLETYILLKDHPIDNNLYFKDGVHIIYPYLITKPEIQKWLRYDLLNNHLDELNKIFINFKCNNTFEDIFDEKVIFDTNWQLYGSCKPNNIKYKLNFICDFNCNIINNPYSDYNYENELKLVKLFSIQNKIESKLILNSSNIKMDQWLNNPDTIKSIKKTHNNLDCINYSCKSEKRHISDLTIFGQPGQDTHIKYIQDLTECLSIERADNYNHWSLLGILLHNIDYRLLETWINFSKKSPKFKENECDKLWDSLPTYTNKNDSNKELNIGSLIKWCKEDNINKYNEIKTKHYKSIDGPLNKLLYNSISLGHTDIANVIYTYYNGYGLSSEIRFICYNIPKKLWCEFRQSIHRWKEDSEENPGNCIRATFDKDISRLYKIDYTRHLTDKIDVAIQNEDKTEEDRLTSIRTKISKLEHSLKVVSFRDTLLKECCARFFYGSIREKFDTQNELICFSNGVYDLDQNIFRNGKPDDFITLTTNINLKKYKHDSPEMLKLQDILQKILPIDAVREYFLLILSSCLSGKIWFEKFFVLTGTGANGKSKLLEFINNCFGEYFHQMNVSALCSKRAASNQADPELALLRARRIVTFQEPTKDEPINVGKLKEWTGGDTIQTRELYKGPIKFKAQAKWFLICNDIPEVPSDDDGTWRRLTIINFPAKFVDKADYSGRDYEYIKDANISDHLNELKDVFMSLLIDYYQKFKYQMNNGGIIEPPEVIASTENERKKNNPMKQYFDQHIEFTGNIEDTVSIVNLYTNFKDFMIDNNYSIKSIPKREDFKLKFNHHYPNIIKKHLDKNIKVIPSESSWEYIKIIFANKSNNKFNTENDVTDDNQENHSNIICSESDCVSDSDSD